MTEDQNVVSGDKLNYRLILQEHIDRCLRVRSLETLEDFEKEVDDLASAMYFNISGVPFRDKIKIAQDELSKWYEGKLSVFKSEPGRKFYNPFDYQIRTRGWRFMKADAMFRHLVDLLAEHGALFESRKSIDQWKENETPE